jgi:ABC-2 type transport system ATP-binding protein
MVPLITLDRLTVRLGGRLILDGLQGALTGRAVGLLGPNGAGKSTLINTLLGFHSPTSGTAHVLGHDIRTEGRAVRGLVGFMPESDAFITGLTGIRFVSLMAELSGLPRELALERSHEAFFLVGLGEARYRKLGTYSLGMKQLAKLAQAIVHGPRLLVLDEPTNGLDPSARERMLKVVREIRDTGATQLLLSSHLLRDVEEVCDEVLILKDGRLAAHCDLEQERRTNRKFLDLHTLGGNGAFLSGVEALGCASAVYPDADGGKRIKLVLPEDVAISALYRLAAECSVEIRRLSYRRDSLEDIFLAAMRNGQGAPAGVVAPREVTHDGRP